MVGGGKMELAQLSGGRFFVFDIKGEELYMLHGKHFLKIP